jgi:hypothetical protein
MDEVLFYIEQHIDGVWDNERYSLTINPKDANNKRLLSLTNKETDPKSGFGFIGYINKKEFDYILTMIDSTSKPIIAIDYKISLDAANGLLTISTDGASWDFKKVF